MTNTAPSGGGQEISAQSALAALPEDPGQEILPVAEPETEPATGVPIRFEADRQNWSEASHTWTLDGNVFVYYRDYVVRADKAIYRQETSELDADGHLQVSGGPNDVLIHASHGEMRLSMHTARFYDVSGSQGIKTAARAGVYSTANPMLFSGRVLIENGEGKYRLIDGSITNCRLPQPDWRILSHSVRLENGKASMSNSFFDFLGIPVFYLPYLSHPVEDTGRGSGLLIPVIGNDSIRGYTLGEQFYWAISRSMDMVVGSEYFSKRGWAPNGDFRYRGPGLDHVLVRWSGLFDRGIEQETSTGGTTLINQGGVDIEADGRKDLSSETRLAGNIGFLSNYVYRLVFNDNYSQATSSQESSSVALTHAHNGLVPAVSMERFQTFAGISNGDEARVLHLPTLRYDVLDRPLGNSRLTWGMGSSLSYLSRSEPGFHARNVGRYDLHPHLSLPLSAGGWSMVAEGALRSTMYTISQNAQHASTSGSVPVISHNPLNRTDAEAFVDIRPPALERDFQLTAWHRTLRHVVEPELTYRYVGGIGFQARKVLLFDTTDIATNTNEAGYSLTQRFYLRNNAARPCDTDAKNCPGQPREWASWQIAQKFFMNPSFGHAVISGRRNVFDSTLDLTPVTFLTSPRNLSPVISRVRFEAIDNLRIQWDLDYDPKRGQIDADNLYAGYSHGRTTVGLGHALLNAVYENTSPAVVSSSQQIQPFLEIGRPNGSGLNLAVNGGYDFVNHMVQYAGAQAVYNWDCCGLTVGYRRFELGTAGTVARDETQWLYSFTLANFGNVGDLRRANSVFRDSSLPPVY